MTSYYYFRSFDGRVDIINAEFEIQTNFHPEYSMLTQDQVNYYLEHPDASVEEVRYCGNIPQPYTPTIEDIRKNAISELDRHSRESLGKSVDMLSFCDAIAGTLYAKSRGLESIYSDNEVLTTADKFLMKGKLCRDKYNQVSALINASSDESEINQLLNSAIEYYNNLEQFVTELDEHRRAKLVEIDVYDTSDNVNGFYLNGNLMWLNRDTRTSLVNTLNSADIVGRESVNIWFGNIYITLQTAVARQMLASLEMYATDCYNVTAQHKVQVNNLSTIEEIDAFDVTQDYPDRLTFNN